VLVRHSVLENRKVRLIYLLIGLSFFLYVLSRAVKVGATYDEIVTLQDFCPLPLFDILFRARPIANNHILNTLLIKLFFSLGNDSLFIARLPNLLAFISYLYWSYKIAFKHLPKATGVGCFILLNCNPFLLDFFSLARGYGLALSFMMAALYFGLENTKNFSISNIYKSLGLGALSVLSLFSMIYFWASLAVALSLMVRFGKDNNTLKKSIMHSVSIGFGLLISISIPLSRLIIHNGLTYGGEKNIYNDTLLSLVQYTLYNPDSQSLAWKALSALVIVFIAVTSTSYLVREKDAPLRTFLLLIPILCALVIIAAHYLVGIRYPIDRIGLFFYPLLILPFCFCLKPFLNYVRISVLTAVTFGFSLNLFSHANTYKCILWDFDSHTREVLDEVNSRSRKENSILSLQHDSIFDKSISYYTQKGDYPFIKTVSAPPDEAMSPRVDYYMSRNEILNFAKNGGSHDSRLALNKVEIIMKYSKEHVFLFKNRTSQSS